MSANFVSNMMHLSRQNQNSRPLVHQVMHFQQISLSQTQAPPGEMIGAVGPVVDPAMNADTAG